jgi:hypothetical protein
MCLLKLIFIKRLQIGTITDAHCQQDIQNAQALGADAFALNLSTHKEIRSLFWGKGTNVNV